MEEIVKVGDIVIGISEKIRGKEFVVTNLEQNPTHVKYIGKHIHAEDAFGTPYVLRFGEFVKKPKVDDKPVVDKDYKVGDPIIILPEFKSKGTQQPFYQVVDVENNGVVFFDDNGEKRWLQFSSIRKANLQDDLFNILGHVGRKLSQLEKMQLSFYEKLGKISEESIEKIYN